MNSYSFPPADDLMMQLQKINYQKLWNQFVTVLIYTAAIVYVIYNRTSIWYQNGGKESIIQNLNNLHKILILIINWFHSFSTSVTQTYQNWQQLVTV
jgi:hypothetical protein